MLKIKEYRLRKKITQKEFAKMLGIHPVNLCLYELNSRYPSPELFIKMAKILEVDYENLVVRTKLVRRHRV